MCYTLYYSSRMASITLRTDPEVDAALRELGVTADGRNRSKIIKEAILLCADLRRQEEIPPSQRSAAIDSAIELLRGIR